MGGVGCFFFNDAATTEIYTLSLHDALPILGYFILMCLLDLAEHRIGTKAPTDKFRLIKSIDSGQAIIQVVGNCHGNRFGLIVKTVHPGLRPGGGKQTVIGLGVIGVHATTCVPPIHIPSVESIMFLVKTGALYSHFQMRIGLENTALTAIG